MKSLLLTTLALALISLTSVAQTPAAFKYQTVVREANGDIVANQSVTFRMTVIIDNNSPYIEQHNAQTNDFGLASVEIGTGITAGDFGSLDWSEGAAELEVEVDTDGGTDFVTLGTSNLLSVPYALHAQTVEDKDDADADPNNEIQQLTLTGNTLAITDGNSVTLPSGGSEVAEEALAKAFAHVSILGDVNTTFDSYNVTGATKSTTGVYIVTLEPGLFATPANNPTVTATVNNDLSAGVAIPTFGSSPSQITVRTYDMNGNLSDRSFSVTVHGL